MAIYEDGTMDVRVDGRIERRPFSINRELPVSNRYLERMHALYNPQLEPDEVAVHCVGDDTPTIIRRREPRLPRRAEDL